MSQVCTYVSAERAPQEPQALAQEALGQTAKDTWCSRTAAFRCTCLKWVTVAKAGVRGGQRDNKQATGDAQTRVHPEQGQAEGRPGHVRWDAGVNDINEKKTDPGDKER